MVVDIYILLIIFVQIQKIYLQFMACRCKQNLLPLHDGEEVKNSTSMTSSGINYNKRIKWTIFTHRADLISKVSKIFQPWCDREVGNW